MVEYLRVFGHVGFFLALQWRGAVGTATEVNARIVRSFLKGVLLMPDSARLRIDADDVLFADTRSGMTPSQMVEDKLWALLGKQGHGISQHRSHVQRIHGGMLIPGYKSDPRY